MFLSQLFARSNSRLTIAGLLAVTLSLALTLYAWDISAKNVRRESQLEFDSLALESEKALLHGIESYNHAVLGGVGFFQGSEHVSREEWRKYVATMNLASNFPGIIGLGVAVAVDPKKLKDFVQAAQKERGEKFVIHPETKGDLYYINLYAEPEDENVQTIGLNIAFEENRLEAAHLARDTGQSAITKKIILLQDEGKTPGFLLLHPLYIKQLGKDGALANNLVGWIYAPFIAKDFMDTLTNSQGRLLNIKVYDQGDQDPANLIYSSDTRSKALSKPLYTTQKKLTVKQQEWMIVWESTPEYDGREHSEISLLILSGGLAVTILLAVAFLILIRQSRPASSQGQKDFIVLPGVIFLGVLVGVLYLANSIKNSELDHVRSLVESESARISELIGSQTNEKLMALKRMAQRWNSSNGTPFEQWRKDALNHARQLSGLRAVEWIDPTYHIKWVEPEYGNEKVVGLDVVFDEERREALEGAAERNSITLTPPLDLVQGYKGFVAYAPLTVNGKFDGFMANVYSIEDLIHRVITDDIFDDYSVELSYDDKVFYERRLNQKDEIKIWKTSHLIRIYDQSWVLTLTPGQKVIAEKRTFLADIVAVCGLLIAALCALMVRYALISHTSAKNLRTSEETFRSAMEYASIGMAVVNSEGNWIKFNYALCRLLGYGRAELQKIHYKNLIHPDDLKRDEAEYGTKIRSGEIAAFQVERRYLHKDGRIIWTLVNASMVQEEDKAPGRFILQIQDITQQKEAERIKSEFISVVSHELRTPLTSIRGSLGLIIGAMAGDVSDKVKRLLQIAHENSERLILLINDILDIDKIASGQMRFNIAREDLGTLITRAIDANLAYGEKFNVGIALKQCDPDIAVKVDPDRFLQVLSNILSNAIKYSPSGQEVEVSVRCEDNEVCIEIRDHGPGIPVEFRSRVFGKFSQADSSNMRAKGGTGLGLHISKQLIEHMHGTIGFDTELEKGTTFWVILPIENGQESVVDLDLSISEDLPALLYVEDDHDLCHFLRSALQDKVQVIGSDTLRKARDLLQRHKFSLIVLDLTLPDGSGSELLEWRKDTVNTKTPIIVLSAMEAPSEVMRHALASMVKSKVSEVRVIETILNVVYPDRKPLQ